jgi:hypothetical protein
MLPSSGRAGAGAVVGGAAVSPGRKRGAPATRGPQTVPWPMWLLWLALNGYLYWRSSAPVRMLLPRGEKVRLGADAVAWRSSDGDVALLLPPAAPQSEAAWVIAVHNAFRGELVHLHAGFHVSLHPLRRTPLVQITRPVASATSGGVVHVTIKSHKKRLTRNTFVRFPISACAAALFSTRDSAATPIKWSTHCAVARN